MKDIDLNGLKDELEEWQDDYKHPADKKQHDFFTTIINAVDRLVSTELANVAQDDHINQQQTRIDWLEAANSGLGKALCAAKSELDRRDAAAAMEEKWVPVSERMPDNGLTVLVYQEGGITFCAEVKDREFFPDEFPHVPKEGREITHWMYMPEPPAAPAPGSDDKPQEEI